MPYTITSGSPTGTYSVLLSNASGSFASGTTSLTTSSTSSPLVATIPSTVAGGTGYLVKAVIGSTTGSANATAFAISNTSVSPATPQNINTGANGTALSVTDAGATASAHQWYATTTSGSGYTAISGAIGTSYTPNFTTAGTYYVIETTTFPSGASSTCTVSTAEVKITVTTPSITTGTPTGTPVCSSSASTISVPFTTTGTFSGTYAVQLSDANGSFAAPLTLATTGTASPLTATIPAGTASGTGYLVQVVNSSPAVTGSSSPAFSIVNATLSISPSADQAVTLGTAVNFTANESPAANSRQWKYGTTAGSYTTSPSGATATTYAFQPTAAGVYYVAVTSAFATCGSITSTGTKVTVNNPTPSITSLSPSSVPAGNAAFTLTINGSNFISGATVSFNNGSPLSSSGSGSSITVTIPASAVTTAGTYNVTVTNPSPSNGTSAAATFTVTAPTATLTVNPTSLNLGTVAANTPGSISTYALTGSGGTGTVTITPPANVEISTDGFATTGNSTSTGSLTVTQAAVQAAGGVTVSVRLASNGTAGTVSGNISNASGNAVTQNVAVTGTVSGGTNTCTSNGFEAANGPFPGTGYTVSNSTSDVTSNSNANTGSVAAAFGTVGATLTFPAVSNAYSVAFAYARSSSSTATRGLDLLVSTDGSTFTKLTSYSSTALSGANYSTVSFTVPAPYNTGTVYFRLAKTGTANLLYVDDILVACGTPAAALTVATGSPSVNPPYCIGQGASGSVSFNLPFTVSGGSLGAGNTFTAYLSNDNFVNSRIALGSLNGVSGGTIAATISQVTGLTTGTAYRIRVEGSSPATASYTDNGNNLAVSSYLDNEVASAAATPGNAQATLAFTGPANCATNVLVTIQTGSSVGSKPTAGGTYTASTAFGSGTQLATGQYVVYNGPATGNVTVTGLTNDTQYVFGVFTTNGGNTGTTGYSNGRTRTVTPVVAGAVAEVFVPQFISGRQATASTHATRIPYVWRVTLSNLKPNATYKYYTAARASSDVYDYGGVGVPIATQTAGSFVRGTGPNFGDGFTLNTDASGNYTGWFSVGPTADDRFADQASLFPMVVLNNGAGGTTATQFLATSSSVTALYLNPATTGATGVQGSSFGTASNFALAYDNTSASGRPLSGIFLESDGSTASTSNSASFFYNQYVDSKAGMYALLAPNSSTNGIRYVGQYALTNGSLVGCAATSANGTWLGGANTASPTGGATPLMLTTGDTPFATPTISSLGSTSIQQGQTLTINGTAFALNPNSTVTFTGSTAVVAASVNAAGTQLTVVVPNTATTGPVTVSNSCGASPASASLTVVPLTFYTVTGATDLSQLSSFTGNSDGTPGTQPVSFATASQTFNILGTGRSFASNWTVSGSGSSVVITSGAELVVPATATLTATVVQAAGSTLTIANTTTSGITQGSQDANSTINLAQTGNTVYAIPTSLTYQNLKLTNGLKQFPTLTVNGNLTFDNTVVSGSVANGGGANTYAAVTVGGNVTQLSGVSYDRGNNITLAFSGTTAVHTITGNGGTIEAYQIQTPTSGAVQVALDGSNGGTVLMVGNSYDGGVNLRSSTSSLQLNAGTTLRFFFDGTNGGGGNFFTTNLGRLKLYDGSKLELYRTTANDYSLGNLYIDATYNTLSNLLLNAGASGASTLTLQQSINVTGTLSLLKGTLDLNSNTLTLSGNLTTNTNGLLSGDNGSLVFTGTGTVGTLPFATGATARTLLNLTTSRSNGSVTLGAPLAVSGVLTLTDGIINTTSTNLLTVTNTAVSAVSASTNINATSYINGPLARLSGTGAKALVFPIGSSVAYRPLTLTSTKQTSSVTYTASQMETSAGGTSGLSTNNGAGPAPLTRVSTVRYQNVTTTSNASGFSGTITLSFGPDDFVNQPSTVVVAKRDATAATTADNNKWTNIYRSSNTGTDTGSGGAPVTGTVTSATFTSFSDFALGATNTNTTTLTDINPLPVELTSFVAQRQGGAVAVTWTTASEKNSQKFVVERSLDGVAFAPVTEVAAAGSSLTPRSYSATDAAAPAVGLYYRLHQLDLDGSGAYSKVVAVAGLGAEVSVVPNPARESVQLLSTQAGTYTLRSMLGQVVRTGQATAGGTTIDLGGLPTGVYSLELAAPTGRVVRKLVKE